MSDFLGLRIALSSLQAQRKGLDVTGQNLANVNTEGYSRQRVGMESDAGPVTPAIHSRWNGTGQGVAVNGVERLRDQFLELRGYQEHATLAGMEGRRSALNEIELAFAEPSDTALGSQLGDFWAGWDDVANRPDDVAARAQLIERAKTLMAGFSQTDSALAGLASSSVEQLRATVADVNATASQVAELNDRIRSAVNVGLTPNDLLDQRDLLVGKLSEKVGVTIRNGELGAVDVYVGGTAIVRGTKSEPLEMTSESPTGPAAVVWAKDAQAVTLSGSAGALVGTVNTTVPHYRAELGAMRQELVDAVNGAHAQGEDLNGDPGGQFFVQQPAPGTGWMVNPALADANLLAVGAPGAGPKDGSIAQKLANLASDPEGPDASYRKLVVKLGVDAQSANRRVDIQSVITRQVDAARESESGVSLDEEMTNMIAYQHAYDAAARFMTTIDSMLETLINRTGVVGR